MSLLNRDPSPGRSSANGANRLLSAGLRSEQGNEVRNSMATSCQSVAKAPKAATTMNTNGLKRRLPFANAAMLLNQS